MTVGGARQGLDPNRWFNNGGLIAAEKIGGETVQYASSIFKYFLAWRMIEEEREERGRREKRLRTAEALERPVGRAVTSSHQEDASGLGSTASSLTRGGAKCDTLGVR